MTITVAESEINYVVTTPVDADIDDLDFESSDETVATVTQDEENPRKITVTGVASGEATITATLGELSATCTVTVNLPEATSITFDQNYEALLVNGSGIRQILTEPVNADVSNLTFTSSNNTIASIVQDDEDKTKVTITGEAVGEATITATLGELTDTCTVTVTLE